MTMNWDRGRMDEILRVHPTRSPACARAREHIRQLVAAAPPLTPGMIAELQRLLYDEPAP